MFFITRETKAFAFCRLEMVEGKPSLSRNRSRTPLLSRKPAKFEPVKAKGRRAMIFAERKRPVVSEEDVQNATLFVR